MIKLHVKFCLSALVVSVCFLFINAARAQTFEWAFGICDSSNQRGFAVTTDAAGNVIVVGEFNGTADFDPGPLSYYLSVSSAVDAFIAKYDANGNFLWAFSAGGLGYETFNCVETDSAGNIYAGGGSGGVAFIYKINPGGGVIWIHNFVHIQSSLNVGNDCLSLAVDDSGNVFATGFFYELTTFGTNPLVQLTAYGIYYNAYVAKLNSSGNLVWVKQIGNTFESRGTAIDIDKAGNVYCTGTFKDSVDFDPGPGTYFMYGNSFSLNFSEYVLKLDSAGNFIWAGCFDGGGTSSSFNCPLSLSSHGEMVLAVHSGNYFNPAAGTNHYLGSGNIICKLDSAGNFIKHDTFNASCGAVDIDKADNVYIGGNFNGTIDFDPGPGTFTLVSPWNSAFILRLNQNLDFLSAVCTQDSVGVELNSICAKDSAAILSTGGFIYGNPDFDPSVNVYTVNWVAYYDAFVWKLSLCNSPTQQAYLTGCDTVSASGQIFNSPGTYLQTFINSAGCDSTLIIHVTIHYSNHISLQVQACDSFQYNGSTLYSSGVYTNAFSNMYGCDSIVNLYLTINSSASTILSDTACNEYYFGGNWLYTSGIYYDSLGTSAGCDSVLTLNLTINSIDTSVIQNGITLTALANGLNYAWLDCNNNYQIINGSNGQSFTPTANGSYALLVFNAVCMDTSSCYTITSVNTTELQIETLPAVFPNPFIEQIHLVSPEVLSEITFDLFDITGRKIISKTFIKRASLSTRHLEAGIYFYSLTNPAGKKINGELVKL